MAFKASPSSQHQHCTDEAQKAETVLSAVIYIYIYIYIYTKITVWCEDEERSIPLQVERKVKVKVLPFIYI